MPFAKQNLYEFIKRNNGTLTKENRYHIVEQIINAIKFAHSKTILHRDISPNNVLVFDKNDNKPHIKVADFGLGKSTESLSYYTASGASGYGQILYVAPEQREKLKDATAKSDIYSLGKLVYFVFTGKDPDNLRPFELYSLVTKSIEDNPDVRFSNIEDFEAHFLSLKELQLNHKIPIEHITLKEVVGLKEKLDWVHLHQLMAKGTYMDHVYEDYIAPVNSILLAGNNLIDYYKTVGNAIREFVTTYADRLKECYQTTRWPFREMNTFGVVLMKVISTVNDDQSRLICFEQLWYLAFEADQWGVQREIKAVFNDKYISKTIETPLAQSIKQSETKVEMSHFSSLVLPPIVKAAIIAGNDIATRKEEERKAEQERQPEQEDFTW